MDDASAVIIYKAIITSADANFKFCIKGDAIRVPANRLQWGYQTYKTQDSWVTVDNTVTPT